MNENLYADEDDRSVLAENDTENVCSDRQDKMLNKQLEFHKLKCPASVHALWTVHTICRPQTKLISVAGCVAALDNTNIQINMTGNLC